jgi:hypothetical protein
MTIDGPHKAEMKTGGAVKASGDDSNAGSGTNPGTVKCHVCPIYCKRYIVQIPMGYWETYICGWYSCPLAAREYLASGFGCDRDVGA